MENNTLMKVCKECGRTKPGSAFSEPTNYICKLCTLEQQTWFDKIINWIKPKLR